MARSQLPDPKYRIGSKFRHIDSEQIYTLSEIRFDTYILTDDQGGTKGESILTLDYDYEIFYGNT